MVYKHRLIQSPAKTEVKYEVLSESPASHHCDLDIENTCDLDFTAPSINKREAFPDWLVMTCAFLFSACTGLEASGFCVFYPELSRRFEASQGAVGWCNGIQFFVIALTCKSQNPSLYPGILLI